MRVKDVKPGFLEQHEALVSQGKHAGRVLVVLPGPGKLLGIVEPAVELEVLHVASNPVLVRLCDKKEVLVGQVGDTMGRDEAEGGSSPGDYAGLRLVNIRQPQEDI